MCECYNNAKASLLLRDAVHGYRFYGYLSTDLVGDDGVDVVTHALMQTNRFETKDKEEKV